MTRNQWMLAAASGVVLVAAVTVLAAPPAPRSDLRQFDPHAVARRETAMWRYYYDHRGFLLFRELAGLLREQYGLSWIGSQFAAYHGARAAVVFQRGARRADYERALPDVAAYYAAIHGATRTEFDVAQASRLELEWWIIHRERGRYGKEALVRSLAGLQSCLYGVPADALQRHAAARAEAMLIRDELAVRGGVSEADWARIAALLDDAWTSLYATVRL